jgi:hypothetical protein
MLVMTIPFKFQMRTKLCPLSRRRCQDPAIRLAHATRIPKFTHAAMQYAATGSADLAARMTWHRDERRPQAAGDSLPMPRLRAPIATSRAQDIIRRMWGTRGPVLVPL